MRAMAAAAFVLLLAGCETVERNLLRPLEPRDFLKPPNILDSRQEFGLLRSMTVEVPAKASIFLAGAGEGVFIDHPGGKRRDTAEENAPVKILEGVIKGGETLDIFATGTARHVPVPSVNFGPAGGSTKIVTVPAMSFGSVQGPIGALVGVFDNQEEPFLIGQRKQINVPRGAGALYLAVLDFPGYSSDNQGQYTVTIDVIRR